MKALVLGAGAVGTAAALKFKQEAMVEQLVLADAVPFRASLLADRLNDSRVKSLTLDASSEPDLVRALRETETTIVLNATLPLTNVRVMRACLEAGCHYIDLASGGTDPDGVPKLDDQFALDAAFKAKGLMALLGMGADPGTTNVYAAYAAKHLLDEVTELHVRDGDNSSLRGHAGFFTAFSPWVFIDECLCKAVSYRDGRYRLEEPLTGREPFDFPQLGILPCYYVDHEESTTLPRVFAKAQVIDFKLSIEPTVLQTLRVLSQLGLAGKDPVRVGRQEVVPRDVVVALLPQPNELAGRLQGKTCVGTLARGLKMGVPRAYYLYNVTDHEAAFAEMGVQATALQTGIPPVIAAGLMAEGIWARAGVVSPEQLDPDPFLERLSLAGMEWRVREDFAPMRQNGRPAPVSRRETVAA